MLVLLVLDTMTFLVLAAKALRFGYADPWSKTEKTCDSYLWKSVSCTLNFPNWIPAELVRSDRAISVQLGGMT